MVESIFHRAVRPPRDEFLGESVYAEVWQELTRAPGFIGSVFSDITDQPGIRDCRVAATVIQWLGTNVGGAFLQEVTMLAAHLQDHETPRKHFYLASWSVRNKRINSRDHGFRQIELILAPSELLNSEGFPCHTGYMGKDDVETADQVVWWLGSNAGQEFIRNTEAALGDRSNTSGRPARGPMFVVEEKHETKG